jgi:shikimate kinase
VRLTTRPLLNRPDREEHVARLLAQRQDRYAMADFCVDTGNLSPEQTATKIIAFLQQEGCLDDRG